MASRSSGRVAWVMPSLIEGSGGHRTMLQNIAALAQRGWECHIYLEPDAPGQTGPQAERQARRRIEQFFGPTPAEVHVGFDIRPPFDLVFATAWYTAKVVRDLPFECRRAYFVQDYEAWFNPMGDGYLMAEHSYRMGLTPITIGRWLVYKLSREYGSACAHFDFCADLNVYTPAPERPRERAVCFICQPEKPRRCARLGIEALGILKHWMPDVKIYLYGSREPLELWFEHENLGLVSVEQCRELYRRCAVGLCISSSNPSRIPFEMMACGLPVVDLHRENNLFDMPEEGVLLADSQPESIAAALRMLLEDDALRQQMSTFGPQFMATRDLTHGYEQFVAATERLLTDRFVGEPLPEPVYHREPVIAGAVRPVRPAVPAADPAPPFRPLPLEVDLAQRLRAVAELDRIEHSRAWRLVQRIKRTLLYRLWARWRYGEGWDASDATEDPRQKLARIHSSRFYRLIQAAKRTWAYRLYARRRYGVQP